MQSWRTTMSESESTDDDAGEYQEFVPVVGEPVNALVRKPTDLTTEVTGGYSFDPLAEQLSSGSVSDEIDVAVKATHFRADETVDIAVEFGDSSLPNVHFDGNELVQAALHMLARRDYETFEGYRDI